VVDLSKSFSHLTVAQAQKRKFNCISNSN